MSALEPHPLEDVLAHAQGLLDPAAAAVFREHLATCGECQATLARVQQFLPAVQTALEAPVTQLLPTPVLVAQVRQATAARAAGRRFWGVWVWAAVAALALVSAFAGVRALLDRPPPERQMYAPPKR